MVTIYASHDEWLEEPLLATDVRKISVAID